MEEILKEMVYEECPVTTLLAKGVYNNHEFCVLSYGTHPCAYVKLNEDDKDYNISDYNYIVDIDCHGGVTFLSTFGENDCEFRSKGKWVGWDYAHAGDRFGNYSYGSTYSTRQIVGETKQVIDMLAKN